MFAQWMFGKVLTRISVNNWYPLDTESRDQTADGYFSNTLRSVRSNFNLGVEIKL